MKIIKRDGRTQEYSWSKVENVVIKTFNAVKQPVPDKFLEQLKQSVDNAIKGKETFTVEEMQDLIQKELIKRNKYDVVEEFIIYRNKRNEVREQKSALVQNISKKLDGKNIENQNANVDEASFGGRIGEASRTVCKNDALKYRMSKMARRNHENNEIYIHDLDSYSAGMHNCLSIPFDDLLANGFKTRQTDVRPAGSVNTAMQLVAVIMQLQSLQQFGGVAATHLDWTMVPYVRKSFYKHYCDGLRFIQGVEEIVSEGAITDLSIDDETYTCEPEPYRYALEMTEREIHQAVEGLYHNLNTLQSRSGNQLPFSSINYGTCSLHEGRMIIKALLDVSIEGLGSTGKTSIFPCGIFQYMKGVNDKPGTPNYDMYRLALRSTAQRLYPNYVNVDWSNNAGYDVNDPKTYMSTMGCRTANLWDVNGLGQLKDGRGNICPVTIILPTIAMQAKQDAVQGNQVVLFINYLDKKINEAKDMLIERFNHICSQSPKSAAFMWDNNVMAGYVPEEGIRSALKHGTLVIGQLGLAEALQILIGKDHTTPEGMALAHRIEKLFKSRCAWFKEQYQLNFGVYYTPAENLCYTAMQKFKEKYGVIENVSDREYFTNSMHVPVWHNIDPFEKIDIESELTGYSSAGCITYVELPASTINNIDALETIVNYAMEKDVPYFAVNVPVDNCKDCGYSGEINDECPKCGSTNILKLRRVTGYLSNDYRHFNLGKQAEVDNREKHIKG